MPVTGTELTKDQRSVVDWATGRLAVTGAAGTGKTTALVERYLALVGAGEPASRILVVGRDRGAAGRFVDACLPRLEGGFDALPITTFAGVAFDRIRRSGLERRLISGAERWTLVRELLDSERRQVDRLGRWPVLGSYLGRVALVGEVAAALARAGDEGPAEVTEFADRYRAALDERGLVDFRRLLELAAAVPGDPDNSARYEHVLVDDFESVAEGAARLVDVLVDGARSAVVAGNPEAATGSVQGASAAFLAAFAAGSDATLELGRRLRPEPVRVLARTHHPALEPEVVAGQLAGAAAAGVPWSRMAVLVRQPGARGRALSRALARHGIPAAAGPAGAADEPVVAGLLDLLRWVAGDEGAPARLLASALSGLPPAEVDRVRRDARAAERPLGDDPHLARLRGLRDDLADRAARDDVAALGHRAFRGALADLVAEAGDPAGAPDPETARALDAAVAFVGALDAFVEQRPGARLRDYLATIEAPESDAEPWRGSPVAPLRDAVTITSLAAAAGREWDVVVVAGCVEGELPRWPRTGGLLGPARDDPLAEERRLFGLATGAATTRVVATAGPEPGQLLSRFVAGWDPVDHRLDWTWCEEGADGAGPLGDTSPVETRGVAPVWPDGTLMLSASKLMTFADCPLQYGFSYALRVRDEGNVWASLGSLFHAVAAEFLRPGQDADFTEERLFDIAESHWSDDIAPYRPQREEIRRDLYEMLRAWRDTEFAVGPGPDVFDVEHWFTIEVGDHSVTGSIDRIDRVAAGLEIIDYKTSKHPMREDEVADDLQLAVYHLAACRDPALAAEGQTARLVLRYVRAGKDVEQPVDAEGPQQTEARIIEAAEEILAEAFTPAIGADCSHCDFHRLCPLQRAGREVGAS